MAQRARPKAFPTAPLLHEWRRTPGGTLEVRCPSCGVWTALPDHTAGEDGTLYPDVVCGGRGCAFSNRVRLAGWPTARI